MTLSNENKTRQMRFTVVPGEFRVVVGTSSVGGLEAGFQVIE
jgi:hypothetical protein